MSASSDCKNVCVCPCVIVRVCVCLCAVFVIPDQVLHNAPQPVPCLVDREVAHGGDGEGVM